MASSKDGGDDKNNKSPRSPATKRTKRSDQDAYDDDDDDDKSKEKVVSPESSSQKKGSLTIQVLTFNVSNFQRHSQAPRDFDPRAAFLEELSVHKPDILALQELPSPTQAFPGYHCIGVSPSHCGFVGLYSRKKNSNNNNNNNNELLLEGIQRLQLSSNANVYGMMSPEPPVVLGTVFLPSGKSLIVGSCHLEPYKDGAPIRKAQLASTIPVDDASYMVLAGDMNMRTADDDMAQAMGWSDAWKDIGCPNKSKFTWNSEVNRYHGKDAFGFFCRFDRVYHRGGIDKVESFQLMAHQPYGPRSSPHKHYYLSDHFGIVTTLTINNP